MCCVISASETLRDLKEMTPVERREVLRQMLGSEDPHVRLLALGLLEDEGERNDEDPKSG